MRVLLSVSAAILALASATPSLAQNIKPGTPATGPVQDALVQASNQLAASVVSQIVPGAIALAPKSNAFVPGYAAWTPAGAYNPAGAKSAGAGLGLGILAGAVLNPDNDPLLGAAISFGATAYGAVLAHGWSSTPIPIDWKVLKLASGVAAVQTLAAGGAQWALQNQPSVVKAAGTGLAVSGTTLLLTAAAGSGPAAPAVIAIGVCSAIVCAAGDAISGNWKPAGPGVGVPGNTASNSNQNPGGQAPGNNTGTNTNTSSSNSNQSPGQQAAGSAGANTNTSGPQQAGTPGSAPGAAPADPTGAPVTTASNSNQSSGGAGSADPNANASGAPPNAASNSAQGSAVGNTNTSVPPQAATPAPTPGGAPADPTNAPVAAASNSNQSPGGQPSGNSAGANTNANGVTGQSGSANNSAPPAPNPGPRTPAGAQSGASAPAPTPPPAQPPIDLTKILEGIGGNAPQGTGPNVAALPPIQQPPPPGTVPPPVAPPPTQPPVTGTAPPAPTPPPQQAPMPVGPTGAAPASPPTEVRMLCYKPTGLDQLVCTSDAAPFCADGSRPSLYSGSRSVEEQCNGKVWTSSSSSQLCTQPPPGKDLSPEFCSPAECRPPGAGERSWQCTPTATASAPPPQPVPPPVALQSRVFAPSPPTPVPPIPVATPHPEPTYAPSPPSVHEQARVPSRATKPTGTKKITKKRGGRGVATAPTRTRTTGRRVKPRPRVDWGAVGSAIGNLGTALGSGRRSGGGHGGGVHSGGKKSGHHH